MVVDELQKESVVTDIAGPCDSNIKKKEYETLEKHQKLKKELERKQKVEDKVVPVVGGGL